jgi:hypothetical protein
MSAEREFIEDIVAPIPERRHRIIPLQIVQADTVVRFDRRAEDHIQEKNGQTGITPVPAISLEEYDRRNQIFQSTPVPSRGILVLDGQTGQIGPTWTIDTPASTQRKSTYLRGNINDIVNDIRAETEVAYHMQPVRESAVRKVAQTIFLAVSVNPYYLAVGTSR